MVSRKRSARTGRRRRGRARRDRDRARRGRTTGVQDHRRGSRQKLRPVEIHCALGELLDIGPPAPQSARAFRLAARGIPRACRGALRSLPALRGHRGERRRPPVGDAERASPVRREAPSHGGRRRGRGPLGALPQPGTGSPRRSRRQRGRQRHFRSRSGSLSCERERASLRLAYRRGFRGRRRSVGTGYTQRRDQGPGVVQESRRPADLGRQTPAHRLD